MPQYRADVWLGSASGRQEITVSSNTSYGAKEQIMNLYDVEDNDIRNLHKVSGGGSSGGGSTGDVLSMLRGTCKVCETAAGDAHSK